MFDVINSITQTTMENNDLEFNRFKSALNEVFQRHALLKSCMFEQTKRLS